MYFAAGCPWGVQAYMKTLPGVVETEAGRANGISRRLDASSTRVRTARGSSSR